MYGLVQGLVVWKRLKRHTTLQNKGPRRVSPFFVPMLIPDMATGQVSIDLGAKGPNGSTVTHVQLVQTQLVKHLKSYNVAMQMR